MSGDGANFSWDASAQRYEVLYRELIGATDEAAVVGCNPTASHTGQAFRLSNQPIVEIWHGFFSGSWLTQLLKLVAGSFALAEGDTIDVDLLDVDSGKTATFGEGLDVRRWKRRDIRKPLISGAKVPAEVLEHARTRK